RESPGLGPSQRNRDPTSVSRRKGISMRFTRVDAPPTPIEWTETRGESAKSHGQWFAVEDHGMAEKSVRPWAHKVSNGKDRTSERVAEEYGGRFDAVVHDNILRIRFVKS